MSLTITTEVTGNEVRVLVNGEVDVSNAGDLRAVLDDAIEKAYSVVDVDLAQVPYIDSTGIGVLVGAAHREADQGGNLLITGPQPNVLRVLTLLGVGSEFHVRES
jgi:anti-sigma B factor antagonist